MNLITGETGSGKSTQLPQYVFDSAEIREQVLKTNKDAGNMPFDEQLNIVITQPRRVAAISMAKRISFERNRKLGDVVSYTIRFDDRCSERTRLRYVTDAILVRQCIDVLIFSEKNSFLRILGSTIEEVSRHNLGWGPWT
jgi:HrpA-like RNA helicase